VEKSQSKIQIPKVLWGRSTLITRMEAPRKLLPEKLIGGDCVARFPTPVPYVKPKAVASVSFPLDYLPKTLIPWI